MSGSPVEAGIDLPAPDRTPPRFDPILDRASWRLDPGRLCSGAAVLAYAVALWSAHVPGFRLIAAFTAAEVLLLWLPWRLPRRRRSPGGYWLESLVAMSAPVLAGCVSSATGASWLTAGSRWWWYLIGAVLGAGLLVVGGVRVRRVVSGELAFVLGPTQRSHALAVAISGVVGVPAEEALFRAPLLTAATSTSFALLAAVAFVACHHIQPGTNGRGTTRATAVEILGAVGLAALVAASGSIYPAVIAHLINNIPGVAIELQRERR
jgi:membrane protease YdiL (CAAX protease family)